MSPIVLQNEWTQCNNHKRTSTDDYYSPLSIAVDSSPTSSSSLSSSSYPENCILSIFVRKMHEDQSTEDSKLHLKMTQSSAVHHHDQDQARGDSLELHSSATNHHDVENEQKGPAMQSLCSLKTASPPPPQHPPISASGKYVLCAECGEPIVEKFYLAACDKQAGRGRGERWHEYCLKCSLCKCPLGSNELDGNLKCYMTKDGHIYCREDYIR